MPRNGDDVDEAAARAVLSTTFDIYVEDEIINESGGLPLKSSSMSINSSSNSSSNSNNSQKERIKFSSTGFVLTPNDTKDPSYSKLELPYRVICRQRLKKQAKAINRQFIKEIKNYELIQDLALDGVRIHRLFSDPTLKLLTGSYVKPLSSKQSRRLEEILARPI